MGYFRIFYYITYILNFILRLIKRHGKAVLWFICIAVFLVICMYNPKSNAVYIGDYDYGDPNYAIYEKYRTVSLDFLRRWEHVKKSTDSTIQSNINTFNSFLYNYDFDLYYWYTPTEQFENGTSMLEGETFNTQYMYILFIPKANGNYSISYSNYNDYCGVDCQIRSVTWIGPTTTSYLWRMHSGTSIRLDRISMDSNTTINIPSVLFHYQDYYFYNYFFNNFSIEEIEILAEMDEKLSNVDETLQQQQEYLEQEPSSEDFTTEDLPTDSGVTATTDSGLNSFFTSFYNGFIAEPNYAQHTIKVPIPFTRKTIRNSL